MEVVAIAEMGPAERQPYFDRGADLGTIADDVNEILDAVREEGDVAVRRFADEFDGVSVGNLDITTTAERAYDNLDETVRQAIETAAANIRAFHERQRSEDWHVDTAAGRLGQRFRPIDRVGAYVPGGGAAYPSSALMTVIPATVAGVEQIAVATPPGDPVHPATLAALHVAGADEIYRIGGAQAIAALAFGTESVPRVRKIVGPGNRWVTAAKAGVRGTVDIDFLAGPSEVAVIGDTDATPDYIAAELLAQAEHGPRCACIAVVTDHDVGSQVAERIDARLTDAARADQIAESLESDASGVLVARSMSEAISFVEAFAPEHLAIHARDPEAIADRIPSAGSVFLGPYTPVAAGDYATGTNHVLPTHGLAKRTGGLSVDEFVRSTTVQRLDRSELAELAPTIKTLANAEGLSAHADSVTCRLDADDA